eukprot:5461587-Amphidinium_carterae.1
MPYCHVGSLGCVIFCIISQALKCNVAAWCDAVAHEVNARGAKHALLRMGKNRYSPGLTSIAQNCAHPSWRK